LVIAFSFYGVTASASIERARSVRVTSTTRTIQVDGRVELYYDVTPRDLSYDYVRWETDSTHIIDIDRDTGVVTGRYPGRTVARVRIYVYDNNNRAVQVGSGHTEITVVGRTAVGDLVRASNAETTTTSRVSPAPVVVLPRDTVSGAVSSETLSSAVRDALRRNETTFARLRNYETVSASALRSAGSASLGGTVLVHFETASGNNIEGRLTINPKDAADLTGNIAVAIFTNSGVTGRVAQLFNRHFTNDVSVVRAAHAGSYGLNVKIAAKISDSLARSRDLRVYHYNSENNGYLELTAPNIVVDSNSYIHFDASAGGFYIISNGPLNRR
jgi:hypothetical protein